MAGGSYFNASAPEITAATRVHEIKNDAGTDTVVEAAVVERDVLSPGDRVAGPAVIVEPQTTTWVSSNRQTVVQADGCLLITRSDAEGPVR